MRLGDSNHVVITPQGRCILVNRGGKATPIPVDEYRREVIARVLAEAHNLHDFRALWIEARQRRQLIDHLLGDNLYSGSHPRRRTHGRVRPVRFLWEYGYHARALKRPERGGGKT
ncbi:hypothetical protein [Rhodanobacter lindaniclasticus]